MAEEDSLLAIGQMSSFYMVYGVKFAKDD